VKVLFLDDYMTCRVVMAEAIFRDITGDQIDVICAGIYEGDIPSDKTDIMNSLGFTVPKRTTPAFQELAAGNFDIIITLGQLARDCCSIIPETDNDNKSDIPGSILFFGLPAIIQWHVEEPPDGTDSARTEAILRKTKKQLNELLQTLHQQGYMDVMSNQRETMERMLDSIDVGLMFLDSRARIYGFNKAAETLTGKTKDEVLGKECMKVFPGGGICGEQCFYSKLSGCTTDKHEIVVPHQTGENKSRTLRIVLSPTIRQDDRPCGVTAALTDITELGVGIWPTHHFHSMVGGSRIMQEVFSTIRQAAQFDYSVLITGESGTGKELAAQAIHLESKRNGGPFVPVNCGALPENILESELFGHVRGAFTGAIRDKKGRFELADGGTLLLDEVGELSPNFQVKLLRVLQEQRFERVGDERQIRVDVRIVSCTNKDLRELVKKGSFREDLFYRLCVIPIHLPPLRERKEDIPLLVDHIMAEVRADTGRDIRRIAADTMARMMNYPWPGNIRELINALQYATIHCIGDEILPQHLPPEIRSWSGIIDESLKDFILGDLVPTETVSDTPVKNEKQKRGRQRLSPEIVKEALEHSGGNKVKAAEYLGVGRATLYRFLNDNPLDT
jgi:PAS domain S-box-containing protein